MKNKELIRSKFLATIKTENYTRYNPTLLIGIIGITGSGKSTISKYLSENLNIPTTSNDQIRRFFNKNNVPGEAPMQNFLELLAEERTRILLSKGISHIIDADLLLHWESAKANAQEYGAKFILIRIVCPEEIILQRIAKREKMGGDLSLASSNKYFERKEIYLKTTIPKDEVFATIDTSTEINEQCLHLIEKINDHV